MKQYKVTYSIKYFGNREVITESYECDGNHSVEANEMVSYECDGLSMSEVKNTFFIDAKYYLVQDNRHQNIESITFLKIQGA
jgi:hypothetical protein